MEWKDLTSRQNPTVKRAASLKEKKFRDECGLFPVEGVKALRDLAADGIFPRALFLSGAASLSRDEAAPLAGAETELFSVSPEVYEKISDERSGEGVLALYEKSVLPQPCPHAPLLLALEGIQDPGNLGTCLRTACALGFQGVLLARCADPFSPKAVRASMGALFRIPLSFFADGEGMIASVKEQGYFTIAACLSDDAVDLRDAELQAPLCLFVGSEGQGLTEAVKNASHRRVIIPMEQMESMNAAVAAAILMWEVKRREA